MPYSDYIKEICDANDFEDDEFEEYCNWIDEVEESFEDISGFDLGQVPDQSYYAYWSQDTSVDDTVDAIIHDLNTNWGYNIKY
jgi:hypothetical protein